MIYSQPRVLAEYPHDSNAFTQGLEFFGERLFESTGLYGNSSIREVDLQSGSTIDLVMLDTDMFGEGLTFLDENRILQLTWKSEEALIWELDPLRIKDSWKYEGQGWGFASWMMGDLQCLTGQALYHSEIPKPSK